jgi:hypothetical protein
MRRVRIAVGLAVALCAFAAGASAALAHSFTASIAGKELSEEAPGKIKGAGIGNEAFKFGPVHINCEKAQDKGLASEESFGTLKLTAKFGGCATAIRVGSEPATLKTRLLNPIEFAIHANGFVETGAEGEETSAEVGGGAVEWKISGIKCFIEWPSQTVPVKAIVKPEGEYTAAIFTNEAVETTHLKAFPSGKQHKLRLAMELKNMAFTFTEGECSEFKHPEAKTGSYIGTLEEEVAGGNLGFE